MGIRAGICHLVDSSIRPTPVHLGNKILIRPQTASQERLREKSGLLSLPACKGQLPHVPSRCIWEGWVGSQTCTTTQRSKAFHVPLAEIMQNNKKDLSPPRLDASGEPEILPLPSSNVAPPSSQGGKGGQVGVLDIHPHMVVTKWHLFPTSIVSQRKLTKIDFNKSFIT